MCFQGKEIRVSYSFLATLKTKPGHRDEVARTLADGAQRLAEAGCQLYLVSAAVDDPDAIVVFELWDSKQHHDESLQLPDVRAGIAATMPLLTGDFTGRELTPVGGLGL